MKNCDCNHLISSPLHTLKNCVYASKENDFGVSYKCTFL